MGGYLVGLRKNWLILLLLLVLGGGGGAVLTLVLPAKYQSSTQLYVSARSEGAATGDLVQGTTFAQQVVASYVAVATTSLVLDPVIDRLGLPISSSALASQLSVRTPANTVMIDIAATDRDPEQAARIADAVADSLSEVVQNVLEKPQQGSTRSTVTVTVVQDAIVPTAPSSPSLALYTAGGAVLGLALGIGIATIRTLLDTRVRTLADLRSSLDAPILGGILFDPASRRQPLIVQEDPGSPQAESYRMLRTNLDFISTKGQSRSFVVTSAMPVAGKSTVSANLAVALARSGARVAVVEADLRKPRVADYLGISAGLGLTDVLVGRAELSDVIRKWRIGELYVLPAGTPPPNPSELLGSSAMNRVVAELDRYFDVVLFDTPPLLPVTDAAVLAARTHGAVLVAASGRTRRQEVVEAAQVLKRAGVTLSGVVMTMLTTKNTNGYGAAIRYVDETTTNT
ncbi:MULTISPECIES: polysaccharide biosynthesis tyrosine autokinase [Bacteria]|uniref:polysaccharide biosynthesis tyrosine autokinase n=1 Tax=Bacteria TaxID=2 RepID=UPI003C7E2ADD